jgi:hypothetical protein
LGHWASIDHRCRHRHCFLYHLLTPFGRKQ